MLLELERKDYSNFCDYMVKKDGRTVYQFLNADDMRAMERILAVAEVPYTFISNGKMEYRNEPYPNSNRTEQLDDEEE